MKPVAMKALCNSIWVQAEGRIADEVLVRVRD